MDRRLCPLLLLAPSREDTTGDPGGVRFEFGSSKLALDGRVPTVRCVLLDESPKLMGGTRSSAATIGAAKASGEETDDGVDERVGPRDNLPVVCHEADTGAAIGIASEGCEEGKVVPEVRDVSGGPDGLIFGRLEVADRVLASEPDVDKDMPAADMDGENADLGTGGGGMSLSRSSGFVREIVEVDSSGIGEQGTGEEDARGVCCDDKTPSSC